MAAGGPGRVQADTSRRRRRPDARRTPVHLIATAAAGPTARTRQQLGRLRSIAFGWALCLHQSEPFRNRVRPRQGGEDARGCPAGPGKRPGRL